MKRTILILFVLMTTWSIARAADLKTPKLCDFYRVEAKRIECFNDKMDNAVYTLQKGDIIAVTLHLDSVEGKAVWRCHQYIPAEERKEWEKNNPKYDIDSKGFVKVHTGKRVKAHFYYADNLITPIDPPDRQAKELHGLARLGQFWQPLYEPLVAIVFIFCVILMLVSLFRKKIKLILEITGLSVLGTIWFGLAHADSYVCLALFPAAIFMPLVYGSILLPWGNSYDRKELVYLILKYTAVAFSFILSLVYFHITLDTWYWVVLASLVAPVVTYFLVGWSSPIETESECVCYNCGYYARPDILGIQTLSEEQIDSVKTTEWREKGTHDLDHVDREYKTTTHRKKRYNVRCRKCGSESDYVKTVTSSRGHTETTPY